jgi:hypothetical protein
MLSYFKLATATLLTFTISFTQDVDVFLTIDGTSLNYESSADIYGFQFNHDGCALGASGGDAAAAGFTISCSNTCLGFSFSGSSIPAGSGTLVDLGGECETLSGFVFAGEGGSSLDVELSDGGGDPVLPTVSILAPADGSSFVDVTSVDVEVSCSDCGDDDHYHAKTKSLRVAHSPPRSTSVPLPKETKLPVKENPKHIASEHEIIKPASTEAPPDAPDAQPS